MASDDKENLAETEVQAGPENPPAQAATAAPAPLSVKQKNISETPGGKITNFFIFYVMGWVANAVLSLLIAYNLNPRDNVKRAKDRMANALARGFGGTPGKNTVDGIRSAVEITFLMISGTLVTVVMTPLLKYYGQISHRINRMLGKDIDVLPEEMKKLPEPRTAEERIQQEIQKRVNKGNAGIAALWLSRIGMTGAILAGDGVVNRGSRILESKNLPSVDTLSWNLGRQVYKIMPKSLTDRWASWFERHDASIDKIKVNMADHFDRLEEHGKVDNDNNSMVIAEQTRIVIKEVGWSFTMAKFMEVLTGSVREKLIGKQIKKAIDEVTREGLVPEGHRVIVGKDGSVSLDKVEKEPHEINSGRWAAKEDKAARPQQRPTKSDSHAQSIVNERAAAEGQQQVLNT